MSAPAPARLDRSVLRVAAVVVVGAIMSILDTTIVNVALEALSRDLHAPLHEIQWVATGYLLALATVIPLTGWAAERFGARRIWMTSVALFVVGSALCGAAWSTGTLILFRVLQGFGGGMVMPVGMIILAQAAGPQRVGRVMSVIGVPMLLGPVLGPVLGGLIVDNLSWRWIFYVNVPIGAIGLALAARLLPRVPRGKPPRLDVLGIALVSPGVALLVFGLSESSSHGGFGATLAWAPIVAGAVLVALFVTHARRAPAPLIDIGLFGRRDFAAAAATTFLVGAALFGAMIILPLYYQVARGESALTAGLLMAPQGLGAALVMPLSGRLTDRVGGGRVAVVGLIVMALGTLALTQVRADTSYGLLTATLVVRGMGLGATMMPAMAAAYAVLDHAAVPRATSALNVIQRVGGSIGTAVLAVVLQNRIAAALPFAPSGGGGVARLPEQVRVAVAEPLADAFAQTFWWAFALGLVALVPALLLARVKPPHQAETTTAGEAAGAASDAEHVSRAPVSA